MDKSKGSLLSSKPDKHMGEWHSGTPLNRHRQPQTRTLTRGGANRQ